MNKLLFTIFFLLTFVSFSQKKTYVLPNYDSEMFVWKGGNDEFYDVKFLYGLEEKINKEILDKVIMNIMVKSEFVLKNKYSFIPKKLSILKVNDKYMGTSEFVGKNSYGVEGIIKSYFEFDLEGNVTLNFSN
jgi:hypothetical protein